MSLKCHTIKLIATSDKIEFKKFFEQATQTEKNPSGLSPYAYQVELATDDSIPTILSIPTGCGKTEAAILSWLWHRKTTSSKTPRKLVYCLPMRTLVEQTIDRVLVWIKNLKIKDVNVVTLIGGTVSKVNFKGTDVNYAENDWIEEPYESTIIIGTQDMLLSRALNRGYGISPYRWPIEFGLLNNDCMWVIDEVQLMKNGLATTLQLQAFRQEYKTFGTSCTMWMSATIAKNSMCTVDFTNHNELKKIKSKTEKITNAVKPLQKIKLNPKKNEFKNADVEKILSKYKKKPMLIIVNNVKRAQSLFTKIKDKGSHKTILVHSRFRPHERRSINKNISNIKENDDVIIISTQAIEAGVDLSSHTMITEVAPTTSMIQRFGRCNRRGEYDDAKIYWIETDLADPLPYKENEIESAIKWLQNQKSASPSQLKLDQSTPIYDTVIRKSDLRGLFDTAPDISGRYLDVARFVRESDESSDISVYWRKLSEEKPLPDMKKHIHDEICNVPIGAFKKFAKRTGIETWYYDYRNEDQSDNSWEKTKVDEIRPGQVFLLNSNQGGYSEELGWDEERFKEIVKPVEIDKPDLQHNLSSTNWDEEYKLENHSKKTRDKMIQIVKQLNITDNKLKKDLERAALFHDIGKAHCVFQNTMKKYNSPQNAIWVKTPPGLKNNIRHERRNFRHEVASALVYLSNSKPEEEADLVAYLIAAHHGKLRLSFRTRNLNNEHDEQFLLGFPIEKQDTLDQIKIDGETFQKTKINMAIANMGYSNGGSWTSRVLKLLDKYGPFKLGYMEALLRIADINASKEIQQ